MKKTDLITGIVLLVFSTYVVLEAARMPLAVEFAPGYGFFPFWLGVLMMFLSVLLLVNTWRRPAKPDEKPPFTNRQSVKSVVLIMLALAGYIIIIDSVGYLLSTLLFVLFLLLVVEGEKRRTAVLIAVVTAVSLYVIFQVILQVSLPSLTEAEWYKNLREMSGGTLPIKILWF